MLGGGRGGRREHRILPVLSQAFSGRWVPEPDPQAEAQKIEKPEILETKDMDLSRPW